MKPKPRAALRRPQTRTPTSTDTIISRQHHNYTSNHMLRCPHGAPCYNSHIRPYTNRRSDHSPFAKSAPQRQSTRAHQTRWPSSTNHAHVYCARHRFRPKRARGHVDASGPRTVNTKMVAARLGLTEGAGLYVVGMFRTSGNNAFNTLRLRAPSRSPSTPSPS